MIVAPARYPNKLKDVENNNFVPISDPFEDIPSFFRTELGLGVARHSQHSSAREGCKTRKYCMYSSAASPFILCKYLIR